MSFQAQLAMIVWLPIVLFFFSKYPPRKAMIISFLGGLLFLPQKAGFKLPLIPDYEGMTATCYAIFIGIIIFEPQIFKQLKLSWIDLPVLLFGIAPLVSSLSNGLGFYDGINQSITQITIWGLPYFLGKLYLNNFVAFKELAINTVKGALIYVPLSLYEIRMSPQLHSMVYGYFPHSFDQTIRYGGWRPQVFMIHGLLWALFMMTASVIAIGLWQGKVIKKIWQIPIEWICLILIVTLILGKSTGSLILMLIALMILFTAKIIPTKIPLLIILSGIIIYLIISISGNLQADTVVNFISDHINPERAQSLKFRLDNEELLSDKARQKLLFGWGAWGRNRIHTENWAGDLVDISITDSSWVIIFGINGLFGLINWVLMFLLPVFYYLIIKIPVKKWLSNKNIICITVLGITVILYLIDSLVNAPNIPIFSLISGGLSTLVFSQFNNSSKRLQTIRIMKH